MNLSASEEHLIATLERSRFVAASLVLAGLWTLESVAPMYLGRGRRVFHGLTNLGLGLLNTAVHIAFAFGILQVTEYSRSRGLGLLYQVSMPGWVHWILAIVLFDCWSYWWHRLNHRVPFFWRFHSVHHADAALDATSAVRFHTCEITLSYVFRLLVLPLIGVTLPQLLLYEAMSLPVILFHHSNIRIPYRIDLSLRWLIVTPWMHWVHHSRWRPETDSNYSSLLSVWDRLFGSFRLRERPLEIEQGLDGWEEHQWRSLPGMLGAPFLRRRPSEAP